MATIVPSLHVDLDGAWPRHEVDLPVDDLLELGPSLRFCTTRLLINDYRERCLAAPAKFRLFGSGDFHHLTAVYLSLLAEEFVLVSFDNHPDWDRRPPAWQCGAWINRALELKLMRQVHLWACTSSDARWPGSLFANPSARKSGRLQEHLIDREATSEWRAAFERFAHSIAGQPVYVTVDLDCLAEDQVTTNWDAGKLTFNDLIFALRTLRSSNRVIGGDLCGGWSPQVYARTMQRFAAWIDHPRLTLPSPEVIVRRNLDVLRKVWPHLTGEHQADSDSYQGNAKEETPG